MRTEPRRRSATPRRRRRSRTSSATTRTSVRSPREDRMSFIVNEDVERYALDHSTPDPDFFRRLEEETRATTTAPQMMVGPLEGQFLGWLVRLSNATRVLEIGTFTGYSSISMALALPEGGRITSLDVNE